MARAKRPSKALDKRTGHGLRWKMKRARRAETLSSQSATDRTVETQTTDDLEAETDEESDDGSPDDGDGDGEESDDGSEVGDASIALQQLQDLMKRTERKDDFEKSFKKKIRDEERRLLRMLEDEKKRRKTEVDEFQSRFASIVAKALAPPGTRQNPTHDGEHHPLHARLRALIKGCESIAKGYERLTEYVSKVEPLPDLEGAWEKDYEELERLAALGREASETEINSLLTYNGEYESRRAKWKRKTQKDKFKDDSQLRAMLEMGRETLSEREKCQEVRGWRVVAHRAEKGLQEIVKALPDEEGWGSEDDSQL